MKYFNAQTLPITANPAIPADQLEKIKFQYGTGTSLLEPDYNKQQSSLSGAFQARGLGRSSAYTEGMRGTQNQQGLAYSNLASKLLDTETQRNLDQQRIDMDKARMEAEQRAREESNKGSLFGTIAKGAAALFTGGQSEIADNVIKGSTGKGLFNF